MVRKTLVRTWMVIMALLIASSVSAQQQADDAVKITVEVPAAVKATLTRELGDTKITSLAREQGEGGATYVATAKMNDHEYRVEIAADGRLNTIQIQDAPQNEVKLQPPQLPAAVKATLTKALHGAEMKEVTKQEQTITYTTEAIVGKNKYTVRVNEAGLLLSKEYTGPAEEEAEK